MKKLGILIRRIKLRLMGAHYCTIEKRSGHDFKILLDEAPWPGVYVECCKCGKQAYYAPALGVFID